MRSDRKTKKKISDLESKIKKLEQQRSRLRRVLNKHRISGDDRAIHLCR